jgi:hypothetical protein
MVGALKKEMKEANSSKWMYMCSTADIPLKWNDIRNGDITPNWWDMRSIADIPKLGEIVSPVRSMKRRYLL